MRSLKIKRILTLGFLILFLIACPISQKDCNPFGPNGDDNENNNGPEQCDYPLFPDTGNVEDVIKSCHFKVKFKWAKRVDEYKGVTPRNRKDNNLIVFYARVKLIKFNERTAYVFCTNFTLEDNQGNKYEWTGLGPAKDIMPSAELNENQEVKGTTTIEVPKTSSGFTVTFSCPYEEYPDKIKCNLGV